MAIEPMTPATIRAELRQRLIDKGVTPKRADVLLKLADAKREGK